MARHATDHYVEGMLFGYHPIFVLYDYQLIHLKNFRHVLVLHQEGSELSMGWVKRTLNFLCLPSVSTRNGIKKPGGADVAPWPQTRRIASAMAKVTLYFVSLPLHFPTFSFLVLHRSQGRQTSLQTTPWTWPPRPCQPCWTRAWNWGWAGWQGGGWGGKLEDGWPSHKVFATQRLVTSEGFIYCGLARTGLGD